jgi:hypothetical protein
MAYGTAANGIPGDLSKTGSERIEHLFAAAKLGQGTSNGQLYVGTIVPQNPCAVATPISNACRRFEGPIVREKHGDDQRGEGQGKIQAT